MHISGIGHFSVGLDDSELGSHYDHSVILRLFDYVKPHRKLLFTTLLSLLIYTVTVVMIPWIIQSTIDNHINPKSQSPIILPIAIFFSATFCQYLFNYLHLRSLAIITQIVLYNLRTKTFSHIHIQF